MSSLTSSILLPSSIFPPPPPSPSPSSRSSCRWPKPLLRHPSPATSRSAISRRSLLRAINLSSDDPGGPAKGLGLDRVLGAAQKLFDDLPQPVKSFPWRRTLECFGLLLFDLACAVARYLSVPVLALSSLSEMSYCGHERKLALVPFPFLLGFAFAGVLADATTELSLCLEEGDLPWHLLLVATFFVMLKLAGPYYFYWGRLLIPHFANGGLWRMLWLVFQWSRQMIKPGPSVSGSDL
ncbi:hypothetical protein AXF42_Ash020932 [Apostasia shenzhenica]|uniref:Uncharacterized protein n=1 Tax=Apostasia shenzhenica TaxID=1088818 RepID=A0A2H9ZUI1_9ASPA|nr:hypothetical protein AXF42_Ash020932 [Apostasia shenzhenica]